MDRRIQKPIKKKRKEKKNIEIVIGQTFDVNVAFIIKYNMFSTLAICCRVSTFICLLLLVYSSFYRRLQSYVYILYLFVNTG